MSMPAKNETPKPPLSVVYDADCAFCVKSLSLLLRFDFRRRFKLYDFHDQEAVEKNFPVLRGEDLNHAMAVVTPDAQVYRGFFAFRRMLLEVPLLYPLLVFFYVPLLSDRIGPKIYAWIARNRGRFGCRGGVCRP